MRRLAILTADPTPRRVVRMLASLRARGVDAVPITARTAAGDRVCLDLRAAEERAQSPAVASEIWSLRIGEERARVPAFGEAARGAASVDVRLVAHGVQTRVLRFGRFPYAATHARTIERILEQSTTWLKEELASAPSAQQCDAIELQEANARVGIGDRLRFLACEVKRFVRHAMRYLFEEARWDVAVTNAPVQSFIEDPHKTWLHWIAKDHREFLADPFVVCTEPDRPRLLCETHEGRRTKIVSIDIDALSGPRRPLLHGEGYASYPYAFDVDGETWVVPEQHRREGLDVYHVNGKATQVASWKLDGIAAVDPSIVEHDGRWWLFCTDQNDGPHHALRIYWSQSPNGPWHAHARNPAKIDVTGARPAGTFFVHDGMLHRPAQDCSVRYGRAITIQRIDVLTPERFEETCVARIDASMLRRKGAVGVHTLSHGYGWVAVDAQFVRWSLRKPLRLLRSRGKLA